MNPCLLMRFYLVLTIGVDDDHVPRIKLVNHKYSVDG